MLDWWDFRRFCTEKFAEQKLFVVFYDVIALLERILATTLLLVVVLVSRNLLLETAVLIAAVQLPGVPRRPR